MTVHSIVSAQFKSVSDAALAIEQRQCVLIRGVQVDGHQRCHIANEQLVALALGYALDAVSARLFCGDGPRWC